MNFDFLHTITYGDGTTLTPTNSCVGIELTKEEYDSWRYNFSEADLPGIHVKVTPSQELSDALIRMSKEKGED